MGGVATRGSAPRPSRCFIDSSRDCTRDMRELFHAFQPGMASPSHDKLALYFPIGRIERIEKAKFLSGLRHAEDGLFSGLFSAGF